VSDRAVIDWKSFDIAPGETTTFHAQNPIIQEGMQAWVDFQCETTRCDVIVEMIEGLTA